MSKIHPSAIISPGAELASDVEVGPNAIIGPKVKIGRGTKVEAFAVIEGNTSIGEENKIGHFSVIGGPPQDLKYKGEDTRLVIGDRNHFREYVTINTGTVQARGLTKVGSNCLFMAYVHVAHDCEVGNNVIIANSSNLAGHSIIEDFVNITGGVGIVQFARIGKFAYIGGHSGIDKSVAPYCIAVGNRAFVRGVNLIGLKRRGIDGDRLRAILDAYKIYFESGKEKAQALAEIDEIYPEQADVRYFVDFIRAAAKTGVIGSERA